MLRRLVLHRMYSPLAIETRHLSSNNNNQSEFLSLMDSMWKVGKNKPNEPEHLQAIQNGSSRFWELGNPRNKYVCVGAIRPMNLENNIKVSTLIDFKNKEYEKLHIEILACPKLLANKLINTFPKLDLQRDALRIIKLSYHKYTDQSKGEHDCVIAANHICKKLNDEGDFGFYSGAAIRNANNEILFHNHKFLNTNNNEIHATVISKHGYMHINNLAADDVGIVYTDCDFDIIELRKWIESID